ncbi:MAG: GNAT family N-acetyltransferase [Ferrimonas sp.]
MTPHQEPFDGTWQQRCRTWAAAAGSDGGHDLAHIERVVATAERLAKIEGAERAVVLPAAWLHDVVLVDKRSPQRAQASRMSADKAVALLAEAGYPTGYLNAIHHAIAAHSWSANIPCTTLEAQIVQDADRLDSLGAIGVSRCLMLGGEWQRALYDPQDPLAQQRGLDDIEFVLDHFFTKLRGLPATMGTAAAQAEGLRRWQWMAEYLQQLMHEIGRPVPPLLAAPLASAKAPWRFGCIDEVLAVSHNMPEFHQPYGADEYQRRLQQPHCIQIAQVADKAAGFMVSYAQPDAPETLYLWMSGVLPMYRGCGLATAMLTGLLQWATAQGYQRVTVKSRNRYAAKVRLLLAHGFAIEAVTPLSLERHPADDGHCLHLSKTLR